MGAVPDDPTPAAPPETTAPAAADWPLTWQRVVGTVAGFLLGVVLVGALWGKMLDPERFAELVAHEELDFLLPAGVVAAIGLGLEAVLGFALLFNIRHMRVLLPSAGLVAFFVFLTMSMPIIFGMGFYLFFMIMPIIFAVLFAFIGVTVTLGVAVTASKKDED